MGNKTAISWTHRTMNPIRVKGSKTFHCVKRSPACDNCYAEVMARRLAGMGHTTFFPYKVHREMPELELDRKMLASWSKTKKPYLNFVTSMTDLGPVDLHLARILPKDSFGGGYVGYRPIASMIHWVVVGGESGSFKNSRPSLPYWFWQIKLQCEQANIPFFFKQWGNWYPFLKDPEVGQKSKAAYIDKSSISGVDIPRFIKESGKYEGRKHRVLYPMQYMPKKQAGDLLYGVRYQEFPEITERLLTQ